MPRNGFYIFSYRPLELWERPLLIQNSYYNTQHKFPTSLITVQVAQRGHNTITANKEFNGKYVKDWFVYECNKNVYQIYPREYKWLDIRVPNKITFATYIPDIVNAGDTLVFEIEDKAKHLN